MTALDYLFYGDPYRTEGKSVTHLEDITDDFDAREEMQRPELGQG